ncbi:hypothetical protein PV726_24510 [Streptomyces europaeiscabiei]|uniref:hypothetical protein n=1 Tax=Streptomyces europaeiscabiei TaxID=146819 RepID=UPI0029A51160|nr:hypothetical protein [Streptomyces europaeiscabiei]MDX3693452.1 hypothetical protein [Streptomyces europaeiscabiei]
MLPHIRAVRGQQNEPSCGPSSSALKLDPHLLSKLHDDFTHHFVITLLYSRAPLSSATLNLRTAEGMQRIECG